MNEPERDMLVMGYDAVYTAMPKSPTLNRLWREHAAGGDFPEEFGHISFVTLAELRRMAAELGLHAGSTLVDLGCGMAGPALWVARETGARLIGVDLSPAAVAQATARAEGLGLSGQARFVVGAFAHTGLPGASADAAMSEDALQYAPDKRAAITEAARILRPGGRLVCTAFELDPARTPGLPVLGTDPVDDYRPLLREAGFTVNIYEEARGWPEPVTAAYSTLLAARAALVEEMGEIAVAALFSELTMTLEQKPYRRRVFVCATRV
ncbi:MAG TPA: methyltransferase domain-containing protein, partial [Dehalococcoidia bacterium]|nr:methyltransferase domain-containing protein [Dehalococcoidia bacterium]